SILRYSGRGFESLVRQSGQATLTPKTLMRDRDGNVWAGMLGQGLMRLGEPGNAGITRRDGLSGDSVYALLEDREGNLWVGTTNGIDRLRNPKVLRLTTDNGLSSDLTTCVYPAKSGDVWVGTMGGDLNRIRNGRITHYSTAAGLPSTTVMSLYEDAGGVL